MVWLLAILAYLPDSFSFAVLLSRQFGTQNPCTSDSGSPGATNMLRTTGKKLTILTPLGDVGKGLLPVLVTRWLRLGVMEEAWADIAVMIDHLYPLYFNFRDGKGVIAAAGTLLDLYPPAVLLTVTAWLLAFKLPRISSFASLMATPPTLPLLTWQQPGALLPITVLTGLIVWRRHANLRDLFAGREQHF